MHDHFARISLEIEVCTGMCEAHDKVRQEIGG